MLVGWGGNNGSTVTGGILANKQYVITPRASAWLSSSRCRSLHPSLSPLSPCSGITWMTKDGLK